MLSRALSLATALLLIGFAVPSSIVSPANAQNLEAGKSPAQMFAGNCSVCHKSARGLLKSVPPGQLQGFLRQHYTTSADMAKVMASYVTANGAGGGRRGSDDGLTRQGRELMQPAPADAAPTGRQRPAAAERQQVQPAPDGAPQAEQPRRNRNTKRQPPAETVAPDAARPAAEAPAEAERPAAPKQKGKKNRRQQEEQKPDPVKDEPKKDDAKPATDTVEPAKPEPAKPDSAKSEPAKSEPAKSETPKSETPAASEPKESAPAKPAENGKPAEAKPEPKAETPPATRSDPVPAVTPAPKEPEPSAPAAPPAAAAPAPEPAKPNAD